MSIFSLFKDFFRFLDLWHEGEDPWGVYRRCYLDPHKDFLLTLWKRFRWMDLKQIEERVKRIKREDYLQIRWITSREDPEGLCIGTLERCKEVLFLGNMPDVYLIIGFFSPDGFVIEYRGRPVIGIGLERFKDFKGLGIILSHEYCHYLQRMSKPEGKRLIDRVFSEGLCITFSEMAIPGRTVESYLFCTTDQLKQCIRGEDRLEGFLRENLLCEMMNVDSQILPDIPLRVAVNFLGRKAISGLLSQGASFRDLVKSVPGKDIADFISSQHGI